MPEPAEQPEARGSDGKSGAHERPPGVLPPYYSRGAGCTSCTYKEAKSPADHATGFAGFAAEESVLLVRDTGQGFGHARKYSDAHQSPRGRQEEMAFIALVDGFNKAASAGRLCTRGHLSVQW